ncbi:MAG: RlmI/RlmK family 23S rRNA methyltransferase, partial [Gammaproteobacteria bacterium]|nr:RlmI/RlmK family 23S rRNA methyltransferase [Gammaproteobacteria bacterium]
LNPEGILVSASCSMHLTRDRLGEVVRVASRHVDRFTQIFYDGRQGFDHPVHPAIPETDYLKAVFCRVVKGSA